MSRRLARFVPLVLLLGCEETQPSITRPEPDPPTSPEPAVPEDEPDSLAWFSRRGYAVFGDSLPKSGDLPHGVATADFNGDSVLDLATATCLTDNVTVFLGVGDGTFAPLSASSFIPAGTCPRAIASADVSRDGELDLITANSNGAVHVLTGNGDGTFEPLAPIVVNATGLSGIATGDFNGDGLADLVVTGEHAHELTVLLGQGTGQFTATGYTTAQRPVQVLVADFDADRNLDLAAAAAEGTVSVFAGRGDGTFTSHPQVPMGGAGTLSVASGDFDGDGHLDLAGANHARAKAYVALGNGDGTFHPATELKTALAPLQIAAADWNGDGRLDLLTASERNGGCILCAGPLTLYLGHGDGTFGEQFRVPLGAYATGIAAVDFNADGRLDLALSDAPNDEIVIFLRNPSGFATTRSSPRVAEAASDLPPIL